MFTSEAAVRTKFNLTSANEVPSELIAAAIEDAHTQLERCLDPSVDTGSPEEALVLGETYLAGAHLFRTLASSQAFHGRRISVGGQRLDEGTRFEALSAGASQAEEQAWDMLEPYLAARPARVVGSVTDSTPVLGEE